MGPHNFPFRALECDFQQAVHSTNAVALVPDRWFSVIPISTAAAETRTLAAPTKPGQFVTLVMVVDGGDCVVTVASAYDETGGTTLTFNEIGQRITLQSVPVSYSAGVFTYAWRVFANDNVVGPMLNTGQGLTTPAGTGITAGTGTVYSSNVQRTGGIIKTEIFVDLTGLSSSTTDLDIIGVGAGVAHLGRITAAQNGTIDAVRMTCLELPAGGADDIDLYSATEGTGVFDGAVGDLTETALLTSGGAWASGTVKAAAVVPAANQYLYLTGGEAGTAAAYTAGKFLIELFGH